MPPKTPSYPPVRGRLDTETSLLSPLGEDRLRSPLAFLPFIHSCVPFFLSSFLPQGGLVSGLPLQGEERGSFFLFIYISLFI